MFLLVRSFLCLADASRLRELSKGTRAVSKGAVLSDLPENHFTFCLLFSPSKQVFFSQWMISLHKSLFVSEAIQMLGPSLFLGANKTCKVEKPFRASDLLRQIPYLRCIREK